MYTEWGVTHSRYGIEDISILSVSAICDPRSSSVRVTIEVENGYRDLNHLY